MKKVVHLIPYDGTGGVEIAARSMRGLRCADLEFTVQSIYPHVPRYQDRQVTYGMRPLLRALSRMRAQSPDLLIVSLWRACIVGSVLKLTRPSMRLVLFLHSTKHAHWLDRTFTTLTGWLADEWWGDSAATVNERLPGAARATKRVISFVTRKLEPVAPVSVAPKFIFWGRLTEVKGIDRAIRLFARLAADRPDARFVIIGPDGGALQDLQELVDRAGLRDAVVFAGERDIGGICREAASACFYLQASRYEGMAMSVVEAMQLGLVPVVTPVGEIRNYCHDGENAVLIHSDDAMLAAVRALLDDPARYRNMQQRATATWQDNVLYSESMLQACRSALSSTRPTA